MLEIGEFQTIAAFQKNLACGSAFGGSDLRSTGRGAKKWGMKANHLPAAAESNPEAAASLTALLDRIADIPLADAIEQESLAYGALQTGDEHQRWLETRSVAESPGAGRVIMERIGDWLDIVIDRPEARNAIDRGMRDGLFEAFTVASLDSDIERVTLRSVGPAFCVGADLAEFGTTRDPEEAHRIRMATLPALAMIDCADLVEVHVQGACIGAGLELAAFARRITASPKAWFQLPELRMGLIPGFGGCVSVQRRIGRERALLMMLSGRRISARTALWWGLIDAIVDD